MVIEKTININHKKKIGNQKPIASVFFQSPKAKNQKRLKNLPN